MKKTNWLIVIVGVILLLGIGLVAFPLIMIRIVQQTTDQAVSPIQQANEQIKTQVSQLLHPTPTIIPDPVTIIHEVQSLARLETIQYTVEKVITAEAGQEISAFLFGDRLLFVAHGSVIAGVDLAKMSSNDLELKDNSLHVRLPDPEVFVATLDNEKSYVYDRKTGLLAQGNPDLETKARQAAEAEILKAALNDGILKLARQNAESYLTRLFNTLGYKDVIFIEPTPTPKP
jgi:Protein of unknown function (DUF4230)